MIHPCNGVEQAPIVEAAIRRHQISILVADGACFTSISNDARSWLERYDNARVNLPLR